MQKSKLIEQLKRHEGVKSHVYLDMHGLEHIACGRNISKNGLGLSEEEIEYLLNNDINRTIEELSHYAWFKQMSEGARKDAIVNIHFNLVQTTFSKFQKSIACLENNEWDGAAAEFLDSLWARQVKGRALELTDQIKTNEYLD